MATAPVLDREEYIEQAYFFHTFRERFATAQAAQEILERSHEEILATTRLPYAIQFLATELKHTGLLSSGFGRLAHYFTAYQTFIVGCAEQDRLRFSMETALLILEREAQYRAAKVTPAGLFVYQFEVLCRNRLGYDAGLRAMQADPFYDADWKAYLDMVRQQVGLVDFADLVYLRSEMYVQAQRRHNPSYEPPVPPLLGEKEGRIAGANRGRDPLYLFAALQRQLGYPEVPRPRARDDLQAKLDAIGRKVHELETRLKLVEGEVKGKVDLNQFGQPEIYRPQPGDEE